MSRQNPNQNEQLLKNVFDFNRLPSKRPIGTRIAFTVIRLGFLYSLCCLLMNSCLVTDEITFDDEPNVPPVLIDSPSSATPIGDIIYFDYLSSSTGPSLQDASAYAPPSIEFSLRVRDENVEQPLEARRNLFVQDVSSGKFVSDKNSIVGVPIGISREKIRDIDFTIEAGFFEENRCYRVELAVTSAFENSKFNQNNWAVPKTEADIAKARWYVVTGESAVCQRATEYQ
jgi:hypothetical protein